MPRSTRHSLSPAKRIPAADESRWLDHLKRWHDAGVCLAVYARSANLKVHRLYARKCRLEARGLWQDPESVSFLPVCVLDSPGQDRGGAPQSGMTMTLPDGVMLAFPSVPNPVFLADLLRHLVGRP